MELTPSKPTPIARRKAVRVAEAASIPHIVQSPGGVSLLEWTNSNEARIESLLCEGGAVLYRGFNVGSPEVFHTYLMRARALLPYNERSSPRTEVLKNIYTSTDYPASQTIFLHNENSYQQSWPLRIFFCCVQAPRQGGQTPLADVRKVLARIDPAVVEEFRAKRWMCVRNFGEGVGLAWQTVFQTQDPKAVDDYCSRVGITTEWLGDRLRTRQVCNTVYRHPRTGELIWFNHAVFFHVSTLPPDIRDGLLVQFAESDLPSNTYYGDGSPISADVLDHIRDAYRKETVSFDWQEGDVLLLDNMLVAHGRAPYVGQRRVLVGMSDPIHRHDPSIAA
jgi:alpha-ketoglutarate-dependent taurine dioxygenase